MITLKIPAKIPSGLKIWYFLTNSLDLTISTVKKIEVLWDHHLVHLLLTSSWLNEEQKVHITTSLFDYSYCYVDLFWITDGLLDLVAVTNAPKVAHSANNFTSEMEEVPLKPKSGMCSLHFPSLSYSCWPHPWLFTNSSAHVVPLA